MDAFKEDLAKLPRLLVGFLFLALGITLTIKAGLGMNPWGVFHDGLSIVLGVSFGVVTQLLGLIILLFSILLIKTKIGLGTVLNILLTGFYVDLFVELLDIYPDNYLEKSFILIVGLVTMTFGRSLYISSSLGAGPRDGLFVGLSKILNIEVKYMKPLIELTVLIIGYFLGGAVGPGTIVLSLSSGYFVQRFFKLLKFDPKNHQQSGFEDYFKREITSEA